MSFSATADAVDLSSDCLKNTFIDHEVTPGSTSLRLHALWQQSQSFLASATTMDKKRPYKLKELEEIAIEVQTHDGVEYRATLWPLLLSSKFLTGTLQWKRDTSELFVIKARSQGLTVWGQRLLLLHTAIGEDSASAPEFLRAGRWLTGKLTLQNLLGAPGERVRIKLSRHDGLATLEVDGEPELGAIQPIPPSLLSAPISTALVEMTSRILLGHTWQTQELLAP